MATQPTQNPVPSESPRDLKFNAGKIDEFVTSLVNTYIDRFGNAHYTIEGLKQLVLQQIYNLGWNTVGTFQDGAIISAAGDIIQDESTGVWYRWDDLSTLPKSVTTGSTPESTGGVGEGKWLAVDVSDILRKQLAEDDGALLIGNFASSAGVISAKLYGVQSGVDCAPIIQTLQDMSESLRLPIDFSGISEVRFTGRIQIGDWFHWKGAGRFNTVIKPLSLTRTEVGTYGDGVYAWFSRKDPTKNLDFAMWEDMGFDGQYQDGYSVAVERMVVAFAWHFKGSAIGRNITAQRCHLKNCPHEGWHGYTTDGGQIDGINYLHCSSEGTNPLVTSVGFNAFKCMNGLIDAPGPYGVYTIRNIVSRNNTAFGHRTLNDFKRGCERWTIDACQTNDMNDCHHSTDGSRFGTFTGSNIGIQNGISYNTKNFFELQAENVSILGGTYKAAPGTAQAGQAGIFIADYKYPSESNYHQSKNIIIDNVNISNVNQGAVRLNNTANVRVGGITAEFCNGPAVSWELAAGHIDGVTLAEIVPSNNQQGDVATRGSLTEINIATGHSVAITGTIKSAGYLSRLGSGNIVYPGNKPYTVMNPTYRNNDRMLINVTSSAPTKTDFATPPVSVPYAFTLNDTNTASAQGLSVGRIATNTNGCVFFDVYVLQGTATAAAVIFRELNSAGASVATTYLNAYIPTSWANRSYIYKPTNAGCVAVEVLLAPACDTSGTVSLTGTTSFADVRLSDMPI
ncbi:hypothetical protein [Enterobacter sp.]|uniref:tail fiber/spike domain-containing protein n=1 Tax=Enterobacter sp. TaxID=42895 RepID=UPI00296E7DEB|nr:hypothetical protein [Enterobacter sp.]